MKEQPHGEEQPCPNQQGNGGPSPHEAVHRIQQSVQPFHAISLFNISGRVGEYRKKLNLKSKAL
jgi:hypothetical protein